jgi:Putative bacterial sensory transduction regulator
MSILIEDNDVTPVNVAIELERAVITHKLNADGKIYVTEDGWYPFWIEVKQGSGLIFFTTHTYFKRAATTVQRLEVCNELNQRSYALTAYSRDQRLCIDHALSYRDGLLRETLVRTCRMFANNIGSGLSAVDPDNALVLQPGRIEPAEDSTN